ncbi:MAG: hypothetical protein KC925_00485 [Candidatus Doudnabacteria bacterium]|nr:hypothetical protein [Candidatus Doudnabacteria bacterium]
MPPFRVALFGGAVRLYPQVIGGVAKVAQGRRSVQLRMPVMDRTTAECLQMTQRELVGRGTSGASIDALLAVSVVYRGAGEGPVPVRMHNLSECVVEGMIGSPPAQAQLMLALTSMLLGGWRDAPLPLNGEPHLAVCVTSDLSKEPFYPALVQSMSPSAPSDGILKSSQRFLIVSDDAETQQAIAALLLTSDVGSRGFFEGPDRVGDVITAISRMASLSV